MEPFWKETVLNPNQNRHQDVQRCRDRTIFYALNKKELNKMAPTSQILIQKLEETFAQVVIKLR